METKKRGIKPGTKFSAEHRAALSAALKGREMTAETRSKMSQAATGKPKSESAKANMKIALQKVQTRLKEIITTRGVTRKEAWEIYRLEKSTK